MEVKIEFEKVVSSCSECPYLGKGRDHNLIIHNCTHSSLDGMGYCSVVNNPSKIANFCPFKEKTDD